MLTATAVVATGLALPAAPASAAGTYAVDTSTDAVDAVPGDGTCASAAGECSLRAAVQEANASPGTTTTITFDPAVTAVALDITGGGDGDGTDDLGDLDLDAGVHVVLLGNRVADNTYTVVKADPLGDRHFEVAAGAALDLVDVTLAGGHSVGDGGSILTSGAVTVTNSPSAGVLDSYVALASNRADGSGGAIAVRTGGSLVVKNASTAPTGSRVDIRANSAAVDGGAIVNDGTVELQGSAGGGMPSHDVYVDTNSAAGSGGGIANRSGTVTIGCRAAVRFSSAATGGDVHNASTLWLMSGYVDGGVATTGGGLFNAATGDVQVKDTCESSQVGRSWASVSGGQIHNEGSITVQSGSYLNVMGGASSIDASHTTESVDGGGIEQTAGTFQVDGHLGVDAVRASGTGGGVLVSGGTLSTGPDGMVRLVGNEAAQGGGIAVTGGSATITAQLDHNAASGDGGGAAVTGGSLDLRRSSVLRGTATRGAGAAVVGGSLSMFNSTVAGNASTGPAAALWSDAGTSTLRHVTVVDNGSGLTAEGTAAITLQRVLLARNSAWNCAVVGGSASITVGDFNVFDRADCGPTGTDLTDSSRFQAVADGLDAASPGSEPEAYEPRTGNPAIDFVTDAGCGIPAVDQEGTNRPTDGDGDGVAACDAGAIEADGTVTLRQVSGEVLWQATGQPAVDTCVIGIPLDDDYDVTRGITAPDGTYEMSVAQGVTYLVAFYAPFAQTSGHDVCDSEPDFAAAQPEWYRNVPVVFDSAGEVEFPDPTEVTLLDVDDADFTGIDACLGVGPGAGADAPCPPPVARATPSEFAGTSGGAGAGSAAPSAPAGAGSSGPSAGAALAMTGSDVSGLWLAGVFLVACGAMVVATSRRELRLTRR